MNSKLNSRKAKDFMGFETVKKGNTLADKHSKSHLKKKYNRDASSLVSYECLFYLESYECQHYKSILFGIVIF